MSPSVSIWHGASQPTQAARRPRRSTGCQPATASDARGPCPLGGAPGRPPPAPDVGPPGAPGARGGVPVPPPGGGGGGGNGAGEPGRVGVSTGPAGASSSAIRTTARAGSVVDAPPPGASSTTAKVSP